MQFINLPEDACEAEMVSKAALSLEDILHIVYSENQIKWLTRE